MCAITGWCGQLPRYFLTFLLKEMETRGVDSTGIAYRFWDARDNPQRWKNICYRQKLEARRFASENDGVMSDARRSLRGIGHTRRASPGMPINAANAHPFKFGKYFFAHNGRITNWEDRKEQLVKSLEEELLTLGEDRSTDRRDVSAQLEFVRAISTDSQVLGASISARDFSTVIGSMALVWMKGPDVFTFRYGKEAVVAVVTWKYREDLKGEDVKAGDVQTFTVVASTRAILTEAIAATLQKCPALELDYDFLDEAGSPGEAGSSARSFLEDRIYRLEPNGVIDEGPVAVNTRVTDTFTSETVSATVAPTIEPGSEIVGKPWK